MSQVGAACNKPVKASRRKTAAVDLFLLDFFVICLEVAGNQSPIGQGTATDQNLRTFFYQTRSLTDCGDQEVIGNRGENKSKNKCPSAFKIRKETNERRKPLDVIAVSEVKSMFVKLRGDSTFCGSRL